MACCTIDHARVFCQISIADGTLIRHLLLLLNYYYLPISMGLSLIISDQWKQESMRQFFDHQFSASCGQEQISESKTVEDFMKSNIRKPFGSFICFSFPLFTFRHAPGCRSQTLACCKTYSVFVYYHHFYPLNITVPKALMALKIFLPVFLSSFIKLMTSPFPLSLSICPLLLKIGAFPFIEIMMLDH